MSETSDDSDDIKFNFIRFIKFLKDNNILAVAIAAVLSERINDVTESFVNNLLMPIINRDGDGDGERDIKKLENKSIKFKGIDMKIGKFIISMIKFIFVTYIIFLVSSSFKKISKIKY